MGRGVKGEGKAGGGEEERCEKFVKTRTGDSTVFKVNEMGIVGIASCVVVERL